MSMSVTEQSSHFSKAARSYESDTGGAPHECAIKLLSFAKPITSSSIFHDCACGPGVVTSELVKLPSPPQIEATDLAPGMIEVVKELSVDNNWSTVKAQQMNGQELTFDDNTFTHAVSTFGIFMFPDSKKGLSEQYRTLKPGGWFGLTSWHRVGWTRSVNDAYKTMYPDKPAMKTLMRPAWQETDSVIEMLQAAGFQGVHAEIYQAYVRKPDSNTIMTNFWPFLKKMIPELQEMSDEDYMVFKKEVAKEIKKDIEVAEDGSAKLSMQAVVAYGNKPE